jgi:hypothetical protein
VRGIEPGLAADKGPSLFSDVRAILLGRVQALFLSVMFCALRNRHKLVSPTLIPRPAASAPRILRGQIRLLSHQLHDCRAMLQQA